MPRYVLRCCECLSLVFHVLAPKISSQVQSWCALPINVRLEQSQLSHRRGNKTIGRRYRLSLPVTYAERSFHRLIDFQCWLRVEKPCASDVKVVQSIRKYGRYHRPIAPPILCWPNRRRGESHGNCKRTDEPRTNTHEDERTHESATDSPDPPVA